MKSYSIILFIIAIILHPAFAQDQQQISGRVYDATTDEGLQFVNVGIEGTLIGTATDKNGIFRFTVPSNLIDGKLYFSAIGYQTQVIPVQSYLKNPGIIALQAQTYGIDDVEIQSKSKVPYRIIRDAVNNIPQAFIHQACNYTARYESITSEGSQMERTRTANVLIDDRNGYDAQWQTDAHRNYRFLNVQRNFEVESLKDGTTLMDDLLLADVASYASNVLNLIYLHEYELELLDKNAEKNDSVWLIAFRHPSPDISRTGHFHVSAYQGKIWIDKADQVPVRVEIEIKASTQSPYGSMAVAQPDENIKQVNKTYSITYQKSPLGYFPHQLSLAISALDQWKKPIKTTAKLNFEKMNTSTPERLTSRQYFEKMKSTP